MIGWRGQAFVYSDLGVSAVRRIGRWREGKPVDTITAQHLWDSEMTSHHPWSTCQTWAMGLHQPKATYHSPFIWLHGIGDMTVPPPLVLATALW